MGIATFLFGFRVKQPREYLRVRRIRSRIYARVAPLRAEISRSPEPVAFGDLDHGSFRGIRAGKRWGDVFDCAWLRVTGEVPAGIRNPVVMLGIGGE
ncbi:MAG: hypothetical protein JWP32_1866, partial [Schumannella sp.]|nr:hypothetical protein [Schumannella sp.]